MFQKWEELLKNNKKKIKKWNRANKDKKDYHKSLNRKKVKSKSKDPRQNNNQDLTIDSFLTKYPDKKGNQEEYKYERNNKLIYLMIERIRQNL